MEVLGFKNLGVVLGELGVNTPSFLSLCGTVLGHILGGFSENPQQDWAPFAHNSNLFMNTPLYWLFSLPWFISPLLFFFLQIIGSFYWILYRREMLSCQKKKNYKWISGLLGWVVMWIQSSLPLNPGFSSSSGQQTGLEARQSDRGSPRPWGPLLGVLHPFNY